MPIRLDLFYEEDTAARIIEPRRRSIVSQDVFLIPVAGDGTCDLGVLISTTR